MLALGKGIKPVNLGTGESFASIAATIADIFGVSLDTPGKSFCGKLY
jgi:phosphopentomutase